MKLNLSCDLILIQILLMRVLPVRWIYDLYNSYDVSQKSLYNAVTILLKQEHVYIAKDITGEKLVYLTLKGYKKASTLIAVNYSFKTWNRDAIRSGSIFQEHHYMLFRFFLDFLNNSKATEIQTDYDASCQFQYSNNTRTIVKPDGIIFPSGNERNPLCIEADTGSMKQIFIFEKLLRYMLLAHNNFGVHEIDKINLYFSFKTKERMESLFTVTDSDEKSIFRFFKELTLRFQAVSIPDYLPIEYALKVLQEKTLQIFIGLYSEPIHEYTHLPLFEILTAKYAKWSTLGRNSYGE